MFPPITLSGGRTTIDMLQFLQNNVLEILLCENCGEVYLGGYKVQQNGSTFLTAEKPATEAFVRYCVLWKEQSHNGHSQKIKDIF